MNLCIISGWRTLSRDAAAVLSGVPPIRLLALERKEIWVEQDEYRRRQGHLPKKRGISYAGKQERPFSRDGKRNGTCRRTEDGRISSYQGSRRGYYENTARWEGIDPTAFTDYAEKKTTGNTRYSRAPRTNRRKLAAQVGTLLSKDNIIATMPKSPDSWVRIAFFTRSAIKTKEEKERETRRKHW